MDQPSSFLLPSSPPSHPIAFLDYEDDQPPGGILQPTTTTVIPEEEEDGEDDEMMPPRSIFDPPLQLSSSSNHHHRRRTAATAGGGEDDLTLTEDADDYDDEDDNGGGTVTSSLGSLTYTTRYTLDTYETVSTMATLNTSSKQNNRRQQHRSRRLQQKHPSSLNEVELRIQLWDAYRLARIILGTPIKSFSLRGKTILHSIRKVAEMKLELIRLQKELEMSHILLQDTSPTLPLPEYMTTSTTTTTSAMMLTETKSMSLTPSASSTKTTPRKQTSIRNSSSYLPPSPVTAAPGPPSSSITTTHSPPTTLSKMVSPDGKEIFVFDVNDDNDDNEDDRSGGVPLTRVDSGTVTPRRRPNNGSSSSQRKNVNDHHHDGQQLQPQEEPLSPASLPSQSSFRDMIQMTYEQLQETHYQTMKEVQSELARIQAELLLTVDEPSLSPPPPQTVVEEEGAAAGEAAIEGTTLDSSVVVGSSSSSRFLVLSQPADSNDSSLGDIQTKGILEDKDLVERQVESCPQLLTGSHVTWLSEEEPTSPKEKTTKMKKKKKKQDEDEDPGRSLFRVWKRTQRRLGKSTKRIDRAEDALQAVANLQGEQQPHEPQDSDPMSLEERQLRIVLAKPSMAVASTSTSTKVSSPSSIETEKMVNNGNNENNNNGHHHDPSVTNERQKLLDLVEQLMKKVETSSKETQLQFEELKQRLEAYPTTTTFTTAPHLSGLPTSSFLSNGIPRAVVTDISNGEGGLLPASTPVRTVMVTDETQYQKRLQTVKLLHTLELETMKSKHTQQVVDLSGQLDAYRYQVDNQTNQLQKWQKKYTRLEEMAVTPEEAKDVLKELEAALLSSSMLSSLSPQEEEEEPTTTNGGPPTTTTSSESLEMVHARVIRVLQRMAQLQTRQEEEQKIRQKTRQMALATEAETNYQLEDLKLQHELLLEDTAIPPKVWENQLATQRRAFEREMKHIFQQEEQNMREMELLEGKLTDLAFLAVEIEDLEREYCEREPILFQELSKAKEVHNTNITTTNPMIQAVQMQIQDILSIQQTGIQNLKTLKTECHQIPILEGKLRDWTKPSSSQQKQQRGQQSQSQDELVEVIQTKLTKSEHRVQELEALVKKLQLEATTSSAT